MKQMWLWFGIVYGNLNALVLSLVLGSLGVDSESGRAFCGRFTTVLSTCRVWTLVLLVAVFGTSTLLSVRKLMAVRRTGKSERLPP